jgi:hypothetical protein
MGTKMPTWKKNENKDSPYSHKNMCFQVSRERFSRSKVELGFHHIHYIYPRTYTSLFDCMTFFSFDPWFDFTIYVWQVCTWYLHTYELHISLSSRKRKDTTSFLLSWWGSTTTTYIETWECHTMESLSFILKTNKNSETREEQRTWDIVLDLIVLSFNCLRPKWRLRSPIEVEGNMGKFESQISLF